jgi:hypothetical protein
MIAWVFASCFMRNSLSCNSYTFMLDIIQRIGFKWGTSEHQYEYRSEISAIFTYLFILKAAIFVLDGEKLIAKGAEVLVALLNFKNFSFKLRNQKILLIWSQVNTVVVL